jgi:hypothetical protein
MSLIRSTATKRILGLFASILLGPGCVGTDPNAPPVRDNSPVQTDSLVYHLERRPSEYRAYVTATFTNNTGSPVYFARCNGESQTPMFGIRRTGPDSMKALFSDLAWACVGGVPTGQIPPGGTTTVRVPVGSVDQPAMQPPLKPEDLVGLMRVDLLLCRSYSADSDYCDAMAETERISNAFLVTY